MSLSLIFAAFHALPSWFIYPFTLGLVAAVNPCGFPLLPIYLGQFVSDDTAARHGLTGRIARALRAGFFATVGFLVVFATIGILAEQGLSATYSTSASWARWIMVIMAAVFVVYGIATMAGRHIRIPLPYLRPGLGLRRPLAMASFGVSYAVASIGCSLPLFIAAVAGSFGRVGVVRGVGNFVAYALGMGLLLTMTALVVATATPGAVRRVRSISALVEPVGGLVLTVVGVYLLIYWIGFIVSPTSTAPPVRFVERVQSDLTTWLQARASLLGWTMAGILVAVALFCVMADRLGALRHLSDGTNKSAPLARSPD